MSELVPLAIFAALGAFEFHRSWREATRHRRRLRWPIH